MKQEIIIIKEDKRGVVYNCDKLIFVSRKKGTITADHIHDNENEILYLVRGTVEMTIDKETEIINAPAKIYVPSGLYHKMVAVTDIDFLKDTNE